MIPDQGAALRPPPPGACDTHMHIYDLAYHALPGRNFPLLSGALFDYIKLKQRLGLSRTVVVQPTAYGTDNSCTLAAMARLGEARGIAIMAPEVTDAEIVRLNALGMRGMRYHMLPGGGVS
jgi:D-galactarolactone isomerase